MSVVTGVGTTCGGKTDPNFSCYYNYFLVPDLVVTYVH